MPARRRTPKSSAGPTASRNPKAVPDATTFLLRDVPADILAVFRERATRSGRSLQQELQAALRRDAKLNFDEARALSGSWHERLAGREFPSAANLIREDRDR